MLPDDPPWAWPEAEWRRRVNQVRAGRSLRPESWPGGARCAVAFSFDNDHDTNELRDGGRSIGRMSWGQYGNRVGVPRILELPKKSDVPATFFCPPSPLCSILTNSGVLSRKGMRLDCMAGFMSSIQFCRRRTNGRFICARQKR